MDDFNDYGEVVTGPGHGFKFAVALPTGLHSGVWEVGVRKKTRDAFLSIAGLTKHIKVSFHESGEWQFSMAWDTARHFVQRNSDRHMYKWSRPAPFAPGLTRGFYITVPRTEMRDDGVLPEDVRKAPDPGSNYWVSIDLLFADGRTPVNLSYPRGCFELGTLKFYDDSELRLVARPQPPDANAGAHIREARESILAGIEDNTLPGPGPGPGGTTRGLFFLPDASGTPGVIELAYTPMPREVLRICTSDEPARGKFVLYDGHPLDGQDQARRGEGR